MCQHYESAAQAPFTESDRDHDDDAILRLRELQARWRQPLWQLCRSVRDSRSLWGIAKPRLVPKELRRCL
jgi:hypothetical protein